MARTTGLSKKQLSVLGQLKRLPGLNGFYLAGGSAVGWLYDHRRSADLDLFSSSRLKSLEPVIDSLVLGGATVHAQTDVSGALLVSGVAIDLVSYPYRPLKRPTIGPSGFATASPIDLAVMKLSAIARRGLRRDFWDLFELLTQGKQSLPSVLKAYRDRYNKAASDTYHVARALTFFDDAERDDPRLIGLSRRKWKEVKDFFRDQSTPLILK
ncbi:MAG: nucleotidyl transferase AbiEii/AbiGii toxin family protein [Myxococcaceae bacterium]|nr:nucleotidyl transferase AbiEii/AbiGii toxin family protein [Myxococcaceae bacterium]